MIRKIFAALLLTTIIFFAQSVSAQPEFNYQVSVQDIGWMPPVKEGEIAGTVGESRRLEALQIHFAGGIKYRAHVQDIGWQDWVYEGGIAGTVDESRRMEAIKIQMVGRTTQYYDVYYRVHMQDYGWTGWARNGEPCGSTGAGMRMEAIQIKLVNIGEHFNRGSSPIFYQAP